MELADLDYPLPARAIAQRPVEPRDSARLLVDNGPGWDPDDLRVSDISRLVGPGDVVVVNDSRVVPARLQARKPTGGVIEVLLVEPLGGLEWAAMVRPSRRVPDGSRLTVNDRFGVVVGPVCGDGRTRRVMIDPVHPELALESVLADVEEAAEIALPPYITESLGDPERYQTVYARRPGSVAAPTAGLHLTDPLLSQIERAGAALHRVDLAVGLGTFLPVTTDRLADHVMHGERYSVAPEVLEACRDAERVVAVGTTTVRALETAARDALSGRTELFIRPGFEFRVVDVLLTNFHQPHSTLLALLAAFVGPRWRDLYRHALDHGYRFLSFGDAMISPARVGG